MRRIAIALIISVIFLSTIPGSSGQFVSFTTNDEISLLRGDYSTGILRLTNAGGLSFKIVSYQKFWVQDSEGNKIPGFNLSISPRVFSDWTPQKMYSITYNISCLSNVSGGTYVLYLRFLAYTPDNSMYIVHAEVPLHVIEEPLEFNVAEAYIKERPGSTYALNGETLVVFSHVNNIGHRNITVRAFVSLSLDGTVYYSDNKTLEMAPGDNVIRFEVPIAYDFPEGTYRLEYLIEYDGDSYRYTRDIPVKFGVKLVGLSLRSDEVRVGDENHAYLTLLSERSIVVNLTVETYGGNEVLSTTSEEIDVRSGTNVLEVSLPTESPGLFNAVIRLSFGERVLGRGNVTYSVLAPLEISNLTYERVSNDTVVFKVSISNPNYKAIDGKLSYRILSEGEILYKDSIEKSFEPGVNEVPMEFKLPVGEIVEYEFAITSMDETKSAKGELYLEPPAPPMETTTTTTTSPPSNTSSTIPSGGSSGRWLAVLLVMFLLFVVGAFYYTHRGEKSRKRVRPKPKRRSPLGRFKKPKMPKFREGRELPKKK